MAEIVFERVTKVYDGGIKAVDDFSLRILDGEFAVLVGPSGCGKTTALRMVAGLEEITAGELRIGSKVVNDLAPRDRDVAMVFQNYALYPHMNVFGNIAFGLQMRGVPKLERAAKVREAARILGIEEMLDRRPRHLSGGQRQRVAMGRAIVREPQAFLMDEPLSNLDAKLRVQMRAEIGRIQKRIGATTLYVTHDQTEAMTMGDRVAVMRRGILQQFDAPQTLYDEPANLFVASFMGSPSMNLVEGELIRGVDGSTLVIGNERLFVGPQAVEGRVIVGMRPEALRPDSSGTGENTIHGTVTLIEALGPEALVHAEIDAAAVTHEQVAEASVVEADDVELASALISGRAMIVTRVEHGRPYAVGAEVALTVDVSKLHYFDAQSGDRIDSLTRVATSPHS